MKKKDEKQEPHLVIRTVIEAGETIKGIEDILEIELDLQLEIVQILKGRMTDG